MFDGHQSTPKFESEIAKRRPCSTHVEQCFFTAGTKILCPTEEFAKQPPPHRPQDANVSSTSKSRSLANRACRAGVSKSDAANEGPQTQQHRRRILDLRWLNEVEIVDLVAVTLEVLVEVVHNGLSRGVAPQFRE